MSIVILGFSPGYALGENLSEELRRLGFEPQRVSSGYDVIKACLHHRPAAVLLENRLSDFDVLKTAVWLRHNKHTSGIPLFLVNNPSQNGVMDRNRLSGLTDQVCSFNTSFSSDEKVDEIAAALKHYDDKFGLHMAAVDDEPPEIPTKDAIVVDLAEAFEARYIKSRLMLRLFQVNRNLDEVDYFVKTLLTQISNIFECELVSFVWKGSTLTEYNLVTSPLNQNIYDALKRSNDKLCASIDSKAAKSVDLITWGRKFLVPGNSELNDEDMKSISVSVDIRFRHLLRGRITLTSAKAVMQDWDKEMLEDFQNQLGLIFSNFIMYHDLETSLSRDNKIFQSISELTGITTLELGSFRSFILQALLILLDLYNTTCGAIILLSEDKVEDVYALGESENFFHSLSSEGEPIVKMVMNNPDKYAFASAKSIDPSIKTLDNEAIGNLIAVPLKCTDKIVGVLLLTNVNPFYSVKEMRFISIFAKQIANQIYNHKTYSDEHIERRSLEEQLNVARDIQRGLLPKGTMHHKYFDFYARSDPAKEVGGDFFDYYPLNDDWLGVAIADISGKGMPASLLMSVSMTIFRSIFENDQRPGQFLHKANDILAKEFFPDKFVTALFGMFGPGMLKLASGGHHPAIVYRTSEDSFEHFEPEGMALGIVDGSDFTEMEVKFNPGDIVVFFTDGLCEAANPEKEQFGYKGIEKVLRENAGASPEEIVDALFDAVTEHVQGMPAYDDTTVVAAVANANVAGLNFNENTGCECIIEV
jgi:serine phosphatase RsbU (regulator of sigma subunit)